MDRHCTKAYGLVVSSPSFFAPSLPVLFRVSTALLATPYYTPCISTCPDSIDPLASPARIDYRLSCWPGSTFDEPWPCSPCWLPAVALCDRLPMLALSQQHRPCTFPHAHQERRPAFGIHRAVLSPRTSSIVYRAAVELTIHYGLGCRLYLSYAPRLTPFY